MTHDGPHQSSALEAVSGALAEWIVERQYELRPELAARYGGAGRRMWRADVQARLQHLAQAVAVGRSDLFVNCAAWSKVAFCAREVTVDDLRLSLRCTAEVLREKLPEAVGSTAASYVDAALSALDGLPEHVPCPMGEGEPLAAVSRQYLLHLLEHRRDLASPLAVQKLRAGVSFEDICLRVLQPAMCEVGRMWHMNELGIAEEHYCTAATSSTLAQLHAIALEQRAPKPRGKRAVISSVGGDLHELGARMVSDFLDLDGWGTIFLGTSTPADDVAEALLQNRANLLAISASTNASVGAVKRLVDALRAKPELANVRVLVGGVPFCAMPDLWKQVGADGWARDSADAVRVAGSLVGAGTS